MRPELPSPTEWAVVPAANGFSVVRTRGYWDRRICALFAAAYPVEKPKLTVEMLRRETLVLNS